MLDLLWLQRRGQLQGQQGLHHVVAMWRWRALTTGALSHFATMEEVVTLHNEGLNDGLIQLCGRQCVLILEVRTHQSGPEADGQVVRRHQSGLTVLTHPAKETVSGFRFE